jgi:hypothetical protein
MLNAIHTDFQLTDTTTQLELFFAYYKRRNADLAKEPTYIVGEKKKSAKARVKKGKTVTVNKLSKLDAGTLALLRKAGIDL